MKKGTVRLTLGPLLFNWPASRWRDFYARVADEAPLDRVVLGELVCAKRQPFHDALIPAAVDRLRRAGKEVVQTTLALVTLPRERKATAALAAGKIPVEVNDLTMLRHLTEKRPFTVGPLVNVYNESTIAYLVNKGAMGVCLPPELDLASIGILSAAGRRLGIETEVWAFGRVPLAISGRCYHARLAGLSKDSCRFVCDRDPDGLPVETVEGQPFLAINGVQTLSATICNLVGDLQALVGSGVGRLRLSPHSCDMVAVASVFREATDGRIAPEEALARIATIMPDSRFSNGFAFGEVGAAWTHGQVSSQLT